MMNETVVRPGTRAVVPVAGVLGAVLVALLVSGHRAGPWWAWFPLATGLAMLALAFWLERRAGRFADLSTGTLVLFGGPATVTGLLLLFSGMADGWPAYPVVVGTTLAAVAWRPVVPASAVDTAVRRVLIGWGAICVLTGLMLTGLVMGLIALDGVRWWVPLEAVAGVIPLAFGWRLRRGAAAITLIALGVLTILSALAELIQHGMTI